MSGAGSSRDRASQPANSFNWNLPQPVPLQRVGNNVVPRYAISANQRKRLFYSLDDTNGELSLAHQPTVWTDSVEMERIMHASTEGIQPIRGWSPPWHNYDLRSHDPVTGRRVCHLDYSVSAGSHVYAVKRAVTRVWNHQANTEFVYPYALANLVACTLRHHRITGHTLRHMIFDHVVNHMAWLAMMSALHCLGVVSLPMHPGPAVGRARAPPVPKIVVRITQLGNYTAWLALHLGNPLTKMLAYLERDERIEGLRLPIAYTIAVVPQVRRGSNEPQEYWRTLIAHF